MQIKATTVRMPDDLHYNAKVQAALNRLSLSDYIVKILKTTVPPVKPKS